MKTKLIVIIAAAALLGGATVVILVREPAKPKPRSLESELPTAMSNYQKTFKLDTSAPHFPDGKPATNQTNSAKP